VAWWRRNAAGPRTTEASGDALGPQERIQLAGSGHHAPRVIGVRHVVPYHCMAPDMQRVCATVTEDLPGPLERLRLLIERLEKYVRLR
jgi:hypothetical protein